jgi:hypothetical protein
MLNYQKTLFDVQNRPLGTSPDAYVRDPNAFNDLQGR